MFLKFRNTSFYFQYQLFSRIVARLADDVIISVQRKKVDLVIVRR